MQQFSLHKEPYLLMMYIIITILFYKSLVQLSIMDYSIQKIKNNFIIQILILAIIKLILVEKGQILPNIIGFFSVSIVLLLLAIIVPGSIGGGDIKLLAVSGLYLGNLKIIVAFCLGMLLAGLYIVFINIKNRNRNLKKIPLGPFLSMGMIIADLWGHEIFKWFYC